MDLLSWEGEELLAKGLISVPGVVKDVCVTEHLKPERAGSGRQAPELHYSLLYEPQRAQLRVALLQGKGTRLAWTGQHTWWLHLETVPPLDLKAKRRPQDYCIFRRCWVCRMGYLTMSLLEERAELWNIVCIALSGTRMGSSSPRHGTKQPLLFIFSFELRGMGLLSPSSLYLSFFNLIHSQLPFPQVNSKPEQEIPDLF